MSLASPSFSDLTDDVLSNLHGYTSDQEQRTSLTATITNSATQFQVDDASQVTRGLIEIESELMWVTKVDVTNNQVYIAPFGRGFGSTTPATHNSGTMVLNNPRFPRDSVKQAIQDTIYSVYPDLFAVKNDETNTVVPVQITYPVAADCELVLDVRWQSIGPSKTWFPVRRFQLDTEADTTAFPTGKSLDIYDGMMPGRPIKVTYIAQPTQLVNDTDTLSSTGLRDSTKDVLIYGACYRLLGNLETSRLQTFSIEQSERSMLTPPGAATAASRYFFTLYSQALQREALRLQKLLPSRTHLVR